MNTLKNVIILLGDFMELGIGLILLWIALFGGSISIKFGDPTRFFK